MSEDVQKEEQKQEGVEPREQPQLGEPAPEDVSAEAEMMDEELQEAIEESERIEKEAQELEAQAEEAERRGFSPEYVKKLRQEAAKRRIEAKQYKTEAESLKKKVEEQEKALDELLSAELESIPEQYRGLVPQGLPKAEQLKWIAQAKKAGLFGTVPPVGGDAPGRSTTPSKEEILRSFLTI